MTIALRAAAGVARQRWAAKDVLSWPNPKYAHDLEGFIRDILGYRLWSKQRELCHLLDVNPRVAAKAGQKVSKTFTLAADALRHFCTYADGRVYVMAPTDGQVKDPIWREISRLHARSGICADCRDDGVTEAPCPHSAKIDGKLHVNHRTGLVAGDRIVCGMATRFANNVSGKSGRLLWLLDECPGIEDEVFEAVQGTMAGGAWIALTGNPTDPTGEFFEAFHAKQHLYGTITISSFDSPNVTGERQIFGLATSAWIEEKKQDWGVDSAAFQQRVCGEFAKRGAAQMIGTEDIARAHVRWEVQDAVGAPSIGIDVAGGSVGGDKWIFAPKRGNKILALLEFEGLDADDAVSRLEVVLREYFPGDEIVAVNYDASGYFGSDFGKAFAAWDRKHPGRIARRGILPFADGPGRYDRLRDAILANLAELIVGKSGDVAKKDRGVLGLPPNDELESELLALKWDHDKSDIKGADKVIDKKVIRRQLGRSPDKCDAVSYACWQTDDAAPLVAARKNTLEAQRSGEARGSPYAATIHDPWKNIR